MFGYWWLGIGGLLFGVENLWLGIDGWESLVVNR